MTNMETKAINSKIDLYKSQRNWSDRFIPNMKKIIGPQLLQITSFEQDTKQASDLIVFDVKRNNDKPIQIACRVRTYEQYKNYPGQFTIRFKLPSGVETEWDKIMNGWADWFFYGAQKDHDSLEIYPWYLIDLNKFRNYINEYMHLMEEGKDYFRQQNKNSDGNEFLAFVINRFRKPVLVSQSPIFYDEEALPF